MSINAAKCVYMHIEHTKVSRYIREESPALIVQSHTDLEVTMSLKILRPRPTAIMYHLSGLEHYRF